MTDKAAAHPAECRQAVTLGDERAHEATLLKNVTFDPKAK